MKVSNVLQNFAMSKPGKSIYKWCSTGNHDKLLNSTLPQVETVLSTACYVWSTSRQKNIDEDQRNLLQIQNVASGAVGLVLGTAANRWVGKKGEELIHYLDPNKIDPESIRKISSGIRVGLPILTTCALMRLAIPTALAGFSGKIMDKVREKRKDNLDAIA